MNRSFGTSSLPRAVQYAPRRKSALAYLGGTGNGADVLAGVLAALQLPGLLPIRSLAQPRVGIAVGGEERDGLVGQQPLQRVADGDVRAGPPTG